MSDKGRTLAESMAIAVLKGDMVAALALADRLQEEHTGTPLAEQARILREEKRTVPLDGYAVYSYPEFRAFCNRLGILWDLHTISMVITIDEGKVVTVDQKYQARETTHG